MSDNGDRKSAWWSWSTHFAWDYVIATLLMTAWLVAVWRWGVADLASDIRPRERSSLYLGTAAVLGIVNALAISGLGLMQASTGPRMRLLRRSVGRSITKSWLSATLAPLAAVGVLIVLGWLAAAGVDWTFWPAAAALVLSIVSAVRLGWVLVQVALIDITQSQDDPPPEAPVPTYEREPVTSR